MKTIPFPEKLYLPGKVYEDTYDYKVTETLVIDNLESGTEVGIYTLTDIQTVKTVKCLRSKI
jgi:hypothetical protein